MIERTVDLIAWIVLRRIAQMKNPRADVGTGVHCPEQSLLHHQTLHEALCVARYHDQINTRAGMT